MASTGIIRRIDDLGRIVIPKEIRRNLKINEGEALEIIPNYNGSEIVIRKYKKCFELCAIEWFNSHTIEMSKCSFYFVGDYTFCIANLPYTPSRGGYAKRYEGDIMDHRIGKVAAYARAMGRNLNKMIGYEE